MTNHQISWQKTVEEMARLCEENAALRERAEKAERQAFNLANGFSPLTPCLGCPAFAGCEKMEARMMRGYDESKHKPCHEHRLEWALGGKPQP